MSKKINQIEPLIDIQDEKAVSSYIKSGGWITEHHETKKLEKNIKNYVERKYAIAVPNGTIAIYLSLLSLGLTKGQRVAVPNLTMIATINAIIWAGAIPVLVDVDETLCMSLESLKKLKNLDAVIFVPLNGRVGSGKDIERWCKQNKIKLIEDSAHALGSSYSHKKCGKLGDVSIFSFTPHKIITMGQGGMILTDKKTLSDFIEGIKTFNRFGDKSDFHKEFGLNFKITDLQASLGNSQFKKLNKHIEIKRKVLDYYKNTISDELKIIKFNNYEVPWFIDICFKNKSKRNQAINKLDELGIETRLSYPPLSKQKYLKKYANNNLNYSESVYEKVLWMPSSLNLTKKSISKICSVINE
jgi:perosamine synthetase